MFRLTADIIFDLLTHLWPFEIAAKMKTNCKIGLKCQFLHRTVNHRKICNASLDALICPLQIINWQWTLIMTLHGVNAHFIHPPSNVQNYLIGHKSETDQPQKRKKKVCLSYIFLHLSANFWVKIQNTHCYRNGGTFFTSGQLALNRPTNSSDVTYSKIQNRLSRVP